MRRRPTRSTRTATRFPARLSSELLASGATREEAAPLKEWFFNLCPPRRRLGIVGAVHIAQLLVPMARLAGYETTVIDPRGMVAAAARFDQPVEENWPDEALDHWRPAGGHAVVSSAECRVGKSGVRTCRCR